MILGKENRKYPIGRERTLTWCPVECIREFHLNFQRHLDQYPGTHGPLNPYNCLQGELDTLIICGLLRKMKQT